MTEGRNIKVSAMKRFTRVRGRSSDFRKPITSPENTFIVFIGPGLELAPPDEDNYPGGNGPIQHNVMEILPDGDRSVIIAPVFKSDQTITVTDLNDGTYRVECAWNDPKMYQNQVIPSIGSDQEDSSKETSK